MVKHPGGRGRTSPNKHITVTVSLSPADKALLDSWVTPELSRSEVVSRLIQAHTARPAAPKFADVPLFAASPTPPLAPRSELLTLRTGERPLIAGPTVPITGSHARVIHELSLGGVLAFIDGAWTVTEKHGPQRTIGPNVVRDMLKLGVLREAD